MSDTNQLRDPRLVKLAEAMPNIQYPTVKSLINYIENGTPTGGFLKAVLSNDLFGAYHRADGNNQNHVREIVRAIYNYAPADCHGSKEAYEKWINNKGNE